MTASDGPSVGLLLPLTQTRRKANVTAYAFNVVCKYCTSFEIKVTITFDNKIYELLRKRMYLWCRSIVSDNLRAETVQVIVYGHKVNLCRSGVSNSPISSINCSLKPK